MKLEFTFLVLKLKKDPPIKRPMLYTANKMINTVWKVGLFPVHDPNFIVSNLMTKGSTAVQTINKIKLIPITTAEIPSKWLVKIRRALSLLLSKIFQIRTGC